MKKKLFLVYLFVLSLNVLSQVNTATYATIGNVVKGGKQPGYTTLSITSTGLAESTVQGTPLLFESYMNGTIELMDGRSFNISGLNVNLFKGDFFAKMDNKSIFVFVNVKNLKIEGKTYIQKGNMILEELTKGDKVSLLKHIWKEKKNISPDRLNPFGVTKWKTKEEYYLLTNNEAKKIKLKEKAFLISLENEKKENVKKFIKKNKLSFKKENDIIKILNYYNSL